MQIGQPAYSNHCQFWYHLGKTRPKDSFYLYNPQRSSIDRTRNGAAKFALEIEANYLLFLDDDVIVPRDGLDKLLASSFSVTAGVTLIRGYPFYPMLFDFNTDPNCHYITDWQGRSGDFPGAMEKSYKVFEEAPCCAVGFSFCLIDVAVLRTISTPYFMTGPNFTEDVYFCQKVNRELGVGGIGYRKDCTTGHILGVEVITPEIRSNWIAFEESCDPTLKKKKADLDRSEEYLEMITGLVGNQDAEV